MKLPPAFAISLFAFLLLLVAGCGRTMTEADCERIGNHMREVWDSDVKATAPVDDDAPTSDLAEVVLRNHREKIGSEWMNQCRRELEGRRVDDREIDCVMNAKTIAQVQACSTRE
jgi:hypothetical protein